MNLISNECSRVRSSNHMQLRLRPGLNTVKRLRLCAELLRAHQNTVKGCSSTDAQCPRCVYCAPSSD